MFTKYHKQKSHTILPNRAILHLRLIPRLCSAAAQGKNLEPSPEITRLQFPPFVFGVI
jgi:hypothetical protein